MKFILFFIINLYKNDCLEGEVLQGLGFTHTIEDPEVMDQDICAEQFKQYGSCVDAQELKVMMEQQQQDLVEGLGVDQEVEGLLGSYQDALQGTDLEDVFDETRQQYKDNKSKCGNGLAKVNKGVLCLLASGQASQYTQVSGSEITVDIDAAEAQDQSQKCEPVVEAICLAGAGQSIEQDLVADDQELQTGNQGLQNACQNIKKDKGQLLENFNSQKVKKIVPKKNDIEKVKEKLDTQKTEIKEKIKDKKGGQQIAKPKQENQQQSDQNDQQKPSQTDQQQKPSQTDQQQKPNQTDQQQKPNQTDQQQKPNQMDQQQQPNQTDQQQKPNQTDQQQKPIQQDQQQKPAQQTDQQKPSQPQSDTTKKPLKTASRRLQGIYNINIRQTQNGAKVVTIADTSGVSQPYESANIFTFISVLLLSYFQII